MRGPVIPVIPAFLGAVESVTMPAKNINSLNRSGLMRDLARLDAYDYSLPEDLIAQEPLAERDASRLMVVRRADSTISHQWMRDLPDLLAPGDCLVLNNSRVLPARLNGLRTATGGKWEGLFLSVAENGNWRLIGQTRGRLNDGETVTIPAVESTENVPPLELRLTDREADGVWQMAPLTSNCGQTTDVDAALVGPSAARNLQAAICLLERYGTMPLPPYIERKPSASDRDRYQTTYAREPGSVAAPTAGLHFTPELLARCRERGIETAEVTLHVGLGTFRPVSAVDLSQHVMHAEFCEISSETAAKLAEIRRRGGRVVAVGTTSARTLEAAVSQAGWQGWRGETRIFIRPPHEFLAVDALLTNFHLPKSTLLMLVSALAGVDLIRTAYAEAVARRYRFFSYGDAMLIV